METSSLQNQIFHIKELLLAGSSDSFLEFHSVRKQIRKNKLHAHSILAFQNTLLFIAAHCPDQDSLSWVNSEKKRITSWCKKNSKKYEDLLDNSGLPYSSVYSFFSYELVLWMIRESISVTVNSYPEEEFTFNELLQLSLPIFERENAQLGLTNIEMQALLGIKNHQTLDFFLDQLSTLDHSPLIRETFYEKLQLAFQIYIKDASHSRLYNQLDFVTYYFQMDWVKKLEYDKWFSQSIPPETILSDIQKLQLINSSRISLLLLQRETDPVTYLDPASITFYELERGISIALFTMKTEKQLALESYVGYTLYKNGYPAAYGGAWVFGHHALIGLNIFEWFRGGESAVFFTQLIRLYHQVFDIYHFEVEPYQYGKDNPEGIQSGAFWFYYRMGFRPKDRSISKLAQQEATKIIKNKKHKSSKKILEKFTESNLVLHLMSENAHELKDIKKHMSAYIGQTYNGMRHVAETECTKKFAKLTGKSTIELSLIPISEFALLYFTFEKYLHKQIDLCLNVAILKANNVYRYQKELKRMLAAIPYTLKSK
jgi:hypothetical protein